MKVGEKIVQTYITSTACDNNENTYLKSLIAQNNLIMRASNLGILKEVTYVV